MNEQHPDQKYLDFAQKWVDGTITDDEKAEYIEWLKQLDSEASLDVSPEIATGKFEHKQKILAEIQRRIGDEQHSQNYHAGLSVVTDEATLSQRGYHTRIRNNSARKIFAAAAVLTGLILSAYFMFFNKNNRETLTSSEVATKKSTDLEAGSTGAVLTLANGKVIVLDTAANGTLASQVMKNQEAIVFAADTTSQIVQYNTLSTPRARQQQLILPDGSRVWLNAESSIRFPTAFTGSNRQVQITGEAYFEIRPDKTKPFIVNMDQSSVRVLGTHFNVMAYPDERFIETTLLEGSVQFNNGDRHLMLIPGQQSKLSQTHELLLERKPDLELVMAWKNGFQSFKNTNLATILRQVRRWYDVDIDLDPNIPSEITFSGEVPREVTLQQLLTALESKQLKFSLDAEKRMLSVRYDPTQHKP